MSTSDEAVVVWGELLWDRFPDGARLGGAPANVAWHLGQAGGWARLVSRVGDDADGRRAVAEIMAFVDPVLIQEDSERATGEVTVTVTSEGEPRYTLQPGRAWERIACPPETQIAIRDAGVLIYGTLAQRTAEGLAAWEQAIAAAGPGCMKVCDVNLRRRGDGAMIEDPYVVARAIEAADLIKVNDKELATLAAAYGWDDPIAALRDRTWRYAGPRVVVPSAQIAGAAPTAPRVIAVTHGAAGSTLYGDDAPVRIAGVPARPGGDNVGCGDAYVAILVLCMTMGYDLADSARAAARWAAAVAGVRGATPTFEDAEVAALLEVE